MSDINADDGDCDPSAYCRAELVGIRVINTSFWVPLEQRRSLISGILGVVYGRII